MIPVLVCSPSTPVGLQDFWRFERDTNRVREEGEKSAGSLQVSVKVQWPQIPCGGGGSVDDTKAHLTVARAAFPIRIKPGGLCRACSGNEAGEGLRLERHGRGKGGQSLDQRVPGERLEVGMVWNSPKGGSVGDQW